MFNICMMTSSSGNIFPHKGRRCGTLMFSLICARTNGWVNNREAGDLRRHRPLWRICIGISNNTPWNLFYKSYYTENYAHSSHCVVYCCGLVLIVVFVLLLQYYFTALMISSCALALVIMPMKQPRRLCIEASSEVLYRQNTKQITTKCGTHGVW